MKIVQFMASEAFGGAEKVFVELTNELSQQHEVTAILLRKTSYLDMFASNVNIVELRSNPTTHNPFLHFELYSTLVQLRPDIIHTHAAKASELVNKINFLLKIPHVGTKHNDRKGRVFNRLSWVTTVSEKAKQSIFSKKADVNIRVINNGVVEEQPHPQIDDNKRETFFTILAVGRLDKIKGFDLLIEQVRHLSFDFCLEIIGEGGEFDALNSLIQRHGLEQKVKLLGYKDDIASRMTRSDLVVISSHQEGGPKVLLEALFYAPMVVSTPVGVVTEVLPKNLISSQQDMSEKIEDIHANYSSYCQIFEEIRAVKKEAFAFSKIMVEYEKLYRDMQMKSMGQ